MYEANVGQNEVALLLDVTLTICLLEKRNYLLIFLLL